MHGREVRGVTCTALGKAPSADSRRRAGDIPICDARPPGRDPYDMRTRAPRYGQYTRRSLTLHLRRAFGSVRERIVIACVLHIPVAFPIRTVTPHRSPRHTPTCLNRAAHNRRRTNDCFPHRLRSCIDTRPVYDGLGGWTGLYKVGHTMRSRGRVYETP